MSNKLYVWPAGPHGMAVAVAPDQEAAIAQVIGTMHPRSPIIDDNMRRDLRRSAPLVSDLSGPPQAWHSWTEG